MSLNKAMIIGRLGQDPEIRYTGNGSAVATLSVATDRKYKGSDGQMVEETEWHRVTMFGRLAEIAGEYLKKGKQVYIEGRLKTSKYEKGGQDHYSTAIIAEQMKMLGGSSGSDGASMPDRASGYGRPGLATGTRQADDLDFDDDDMIPF